MFLSPNYTFLFTRVDKSLYHQDPTVYLSICSHFSYNLKYCFLPSSHSPHSTPSFFLPYGSYPYTKNLPHFFALIFRGKKVLLIYTIFTLSPRSTTPLKQPCSGSKSYSSNSQTSVFIYLNSSILFVISVNSLLAILPLLCFPTTVSLVNSLHQLLPLCVFFARSSCSS